MQLAIVVFVAHLTAAGAPAPAAALVAPEGAQEAPSAETSVGDDATDRGSVLVQFERDIRVSEDERAGLVVAVGGDAEIEGEVTALAVIGGDARLEGARIGDLLVVQGRAVIDGESVVTGDVHLRDAELQAEPGATLAGEVRRDAPPWEQAGRTVLTTLFGLGLAGTAVLAAMLAAALAPRGVRRAGGSLIGEVWKTLLAAVIVWIAVPIAAAVAVLTVIAAPLGMAVWTVGLPALALVGYLVAGIRVGDAFLGATRRCVEVRPIGAAAIGVLILIGLGLVPFVGPVVNVLAALLGAGAVALTLWRAARSRAEPPMPTAISR